MPNDGIAAPPTPIIKRKPDPDEIIEGNMDEDDPDGGESLEIDKALIDTGQAPNLKEDELDTEPVDGPIKHAIDNAADE